MASAADRVAKAAVTYFHAQRAYDHDIEGVASNRIGDGALAESGRARDLAWGALGDAVRDYEAKAKQADPDPGPDPDPESEPEADPDVDIDSALDDGDGDSDDTGKTATAGRRRNRGGGR